MERPNRCDYFMCVSCSTHIASREHFHSVCWGRVRCGLFNTAVNVREDEADRHLEVHSNTLARVYCVNCGGWLGYKFVQVAPGQTYARNGMVNLYIDMLWGKRGNELLCRDVLLQELIRNEIVVERIDEHEGTWGARLIRHN